jgi:iron complex transport system substrate-binding protein
MMRIIGLYIVIFFVSGCQTLPEKKEDKAPTQLKYAKGFTVVDEGSFKRVQVTTPYPNAKEGITYLLVPHDSELPQDSSHAIIIRTPIERIVCTSTSHIPLLDYLGESEKLVGFPTTDYISSPKMRQRIDSGLVAELGIDKRINIELLTAIEADLVMAYSMTSDLGQLKKIQDLGTPVVINAEFLEKHPLGRAEWIKFMALFFNDEARADSIFAVIESAYLTGKASAEKIESAPTVMSGIVYGDTWFLPGGQNYAARLLKDAGCRYLWSDDTSHGFLELSFESVYNTAREADLWIGVGSFQSLVDIRQADSRYTNFEAFKQGKVYTYNARYGPKGGSEFLELGYLRPDLILNDLIKIAHPTLLPGYELFFHKKLE